jgi:hypothetical protein
VIHLFLKMLKADMLPTQPPISVDTGGSFPLSSNTKLLGLEADH